MSRIARAVVPYVPHHVTQRGNRGEQIFVVADDYALYRDWLGKAVGVRRRVWAYCRCPTTST